MEKEINYSESKINEQLAFNDGYVAGMLKTIVTAAVVLGCNKIYSYSMDTIRFRSAKKVVEKYLTKIDNKESLNPYEKANLHLAINTLNDMLVDKKGTKSQRLQIMGLLKETDSKGLH